MFFGCSGKSGKTDKPPSIHKKYPASLLLEDFDQIIRVLKKNHVALYDYITQDDFNNLVSNQKGKINDSLTVSEFYDVIAPIVHNIGCGHTVLDLPEWVWANSAISIQRQISIIDDRAWIKAGLEVLSINGVPVPNLLQHVVSYASTDGENVSARKEHMKRSFNLYVASYLSFPEKYEVEVKSKNDSIHYESLPTLSIKQYRADLWRDAPPILDFDIDTVESLAVITIRSFGFYNEVEKFKSFVDESFAAISKSKCRNAILDLRGNRGGDPLCASHLFTYLIDKPTPYFSEPYGGYENLARKLDPVAGGFHGKLYTLIDGACFSTTGHLSALLRYHGIGEFIGSETGGTYTCNDGSQTYKLINSGILIRVPGTTFEVAVAGIERFEGIDPDYVVESSLKDFLDEKDSVMEFAKLRVRMQP